MVSRSIPLFCAILLFILGTLVLVGWMLQWPLLVQLSPGFMAMVPNSALCFILTGISIVLSNADQQFKYIRPAIITLNLLVLVIALLSLIQNIFQIDLGINRLLVNIWVEDPNPAPGRMAPNTALAFMLSAFIGLCLPHGGKKKIGLLIQIATFTILMISVTGLLIYSLKLEYLFNNYSYTRMALHTACGFFLISIAWWTTWRNSQWFKEYYKGHEDRKIILMTGFLLITIALIESVGSVTVMTFFNLKIIHQGFETLLKTKVTIFNDTIQGYEERTKNLTLNFLSLRSANLMHTERLRHYLNGYSGVKLIDDKNRVIFQDGQFIKPATRIKINSAFNTHLLWHNGFWAQSSIPLQINGKNILLTTESPLSRLTQAYKNTQSLGESGEFAVCSKLNENEASCFPTRLYDKPFNVPFFVEGKVIPMYYALNGKTGTTSSLDYRRKQIIASYTPIGNLGLGIVAKIDASEIYYPIRQQAVFLFPASAALILVGLLLLYWQIVPLVRKVVNSEQEALKNKLELEESEQRYESAIKASNTGLWELDLKTKKVTYSPNFKIILGYKEEEFSDNFSDFFVLVHPEDENKIKQALEKHVTMGSPFNVEVRLRLKSGEYNWFQISGKAMSDTENKEHMTGTLINISERKRVDELKSEFISVVSHELRTPLTSIKGSIALLLGGKVANLNESEKKLLTIANNNCERLINLINDILDIEKIESGKISLQFKPIAINKLVQESIVLNHMYAEKFGVQVKLEKSHTDALVMADSDRITQVMINLLSNAVKYSPHNETIQVKIKNKNGIVRVAVSDKGKGIPEEFKNKIFQKFSQANTKTNRQVGGTGLGLSISKAIIDKHAGKISFQNNPSGGTTFYFELPEFVSTHELTTSPS